MKWGRILFAALVALAIAFGRGGTACEEPSASAFRSVMLAPVGDAGAPVGPVLVSTWAVNGIGAIDQSTGVGYPGGNCQSSTNTQPYSNTTVFDSDGGYNFLANATMVASPTYFGTNYSFHPLDCSINFIRPNSVLTSGTGFNQYPTNINAISAGNGLSADYVANTDTALALDAGYGAFVINSTVTGVNGTTLAGRTKGGSLNAYAAAISDITIANNLTAHPITAVTLGNPTTVTSVGHNLTTGNYAFVQGVGGTTEINGYWQVTVLSSSQYTIPVNSTHAFTGGTLTACPVGASNPCAYQTSYGISALVSMDGESDAYFATSVATFQSETQSWPTNLLSDLAPVTGQTQSIPLFVTQQNSSDIINYGVPETNLTAAAQRGFIGTTNDYVSGPSYQDPGNAVGSPHFTGAGYLWRDEMAAESIDQVRRGNGWLPLYATSKTIVDSTHILINFHIPVPPLQFDGALTPPHTAGTYAGTYGPFWAGAKGFEAYDDTGISISQVSGSATSPIQVTTSAPIAGSAIITGNTICTPGDVSSNTNANGCFAITTTGASTFTLNGTTGQGAGCSSSCLFVAFNLIRLLPISSATICTGSGTPASQCQNSSQVLLVLGTAAVGTIKIGYADTPDNTGSAGTQGCNNSGACGLLMDSRNFCGLSGHCQNDYALAFSGL